MPRLAGAPPPLVGRLVGALLPVALLVATPLWVPCGPSCAPCVTARGRFAAYCGAAACRYPVPWAVFPVRCVATCSACGAPFWVMPGLVGAPLPLVRLLVGAHLPFALPSLTAPRLCELTFEAPPPAPLLVGLLRLSRLGLLALSGPLSNVQWALC